MTNNIAIATEQNFSDHETSHSIDPEVARLASTIDYHSSLSIQSFGSELAIKTAQYTDEILGNSRVSGLAETGDQLNQIVHAVQAFDLKQLDNSTARMPVVGGLLKRFTQSKEKMMARFETVRTQVEKIVSQVESTADLLNRRNRDYQSMYDSVREEHAVLGQHADAIDLRLADVNREIASQPNAGTDMVSIEKAAVLESAKNQLSKRADDLRMLQHTAMQMLSMVRVIQSNNLLLVDKFQTIQTLTLPTWKRTFLLALTLDEQKNAVDLANSIDDATNTMMRRNAELLRQNSVATAQANQRLVVDIDTLRDVHNTILMTLSDVRDAHSKGAAERADAMVELERLRQEMSKDAKAITLSGARHA